jgi:hypothetical protein
MFNERDYDLMELEAEQFIDTVLAEFEQEYKGARYGGQGADNANGENIGETIGGGEELLQQEQPVA